MRKLHQIASATTLSAAQLVQRATRSPAELTSDEIKLLKKRFWADETEADRRALIDAERGLVRVSRDYYKHTVEELEQLRARFYDGNEGEAIGNAWHEADWRWKAERKKVKDEELQWTLASDRCPAWMKKWIRETGADESWGFARYIDPAAALKYDIEEYDSCTGALFLNTGAELGFCSPIKSRFTLDEIQWPGPQPDLIEIRSRSAAQAREESEYANTPEPDAPKEDPDDAEGRAKFQMLREHFKAIRHQEGPAAHLHTLLKNVFIVLDDAAMYRQNGV